MVATNFVGTQQMTRAVFYFLKDTKKIMKDTQKELLQYSTQTNLVLCVPNDGQ